MSCLRIPITRISPNSVAMVMTLVMACGSSFFYFDAKGIGFNPDQSADAFTHIDEDSPASAQSFPVYWKDCFVKEGALAITRGPSRDVALLDVEIRPTDPMGVPLDAPDTALASLRISTAELPDPSVDEFTSFDFEGPAGGPEVQRDESYALVVEFVERLTSTDSLPVATVLGASGAVEDPYDEGEAFVGASNVGFMPTGNDFFFDVILWCE